MDQQSAERMPELLDGDPTDPMFEDGSKVRSRADVNAAVDKLLRLLDETGAPPDAAIGVVGRNRPLHGAAVLGLLAAGRGVTMIYAFQSPESLAADIRSSAFAAIVADQQDWSPEVEAAARETRTAGVSLLSDRFDCALRPGLETSAAMSPRRLSKGVAIEVLSSGTTGKPKRIPLQRSVLSRAVDGALASGRALKGAYDISPWPLSSIGGISVLLGAAMIGRPISYLDKFRVDEWVAAIKRHRPTLVTAMPAMLRMVLDADVPPEALASVDIVYGGSAHLDLDLKDAFEKRYGVTVLWAYGATEFCGTIVSWNKELHDEWGERKRGASGRPLPGVSLRAVDEEGRVLPPGKKGFLEALVPVISSDWIHTTDLVVLDEDGFMFHYGRGDGAIVRGGFKVLPETIREALCSHPAVLDASAVGLPDPRLGAVPAAAVEIKADMDRPAPDELIQFLRSRLPSQAIPARLIIVDVLPRTPTMKVEVNAVKKLFD